MHKAWSNIEEMPYCFSRSYVKLQGHTALKIVEFDPDWSFPDCNSILNSPMPPKWCTKLEVALKRYPIVFQGHRQISRSHDSKIVEFDPNWAFPDCNSSLNSPMAMKCCTKLETAKERCAIVFQGHPSTFNVTRDKTSPILTQIGRFRTIGRSQLSNPSDLPCSIWFFLKLIWPLYCVLSMWGKIMIPAYGFWLYDLHGLYGLQCPLSSKLC